MNWKLAGMTLVGALAFGGSAGLAADAPGTEPWTLERAVRHALEHSPDARLAQQRIEGARAGMEQANAMLWPRLQLQSGYTRTDNPLMAFGAILNQRSVATGLDYNAVPEVDNLNVRGVVSVPLYAGGSIRAAREGAAAGTRAASLTAEVVRRDLAFEVARAFHTVQKARAFVGATEAAVTAFESNLAVARKRHGAGALLKADLLDVEVRLAQAREDALRARNGLELAERILRNLLGIEGGGPPFVVADHVPAVSVPQEADPGGRAELAVIRERQQAAEAAVRAARGGYLPRVNAFGSVEYNYGWELEGEGTSWAAGAMLEWNAWDGQLTRARVREARVGVESLVEEERKVRLAIELEVEQARLNVREATERQGVTDKAVALATESVGLTRARFEQGLALSAQLIDAETALTGARVRRAEAEGDYRIAVAGLRRALGWPQLDTGN